MDYVDPLRWPLTSAFIRVYDKEQAAWMQRQPTLAWAYGKVLDRQERDIERYQ